VNVVDAKEERGKEEKMKEKGKEEELREGMLQGN
jgi:hypothetical protein